MVGHLRQGAPPVLRATSATAHPGKAVRALRPAHVRDELQHRRRLGRRLRRRGGGRLQRSRLRPRSAAVRTVPSTPVSAPAGAAPTGDDAGTPTNLFEPQVRRRSSCHEPIDITRSGSTPPPTCGDGRSASTGERHDRGVARRDTYTDVLDNTGERVHAERRRRTPQRRDSDRPAARRPLRAGARSTQPDARRSRRTAPTARSPVARSPT